MSLDSGVVPLAADPEDPLKPVEYWAPVVTDPPYKALGIMFLVFCLYLAFAYWMGWPI